MRMRTFVSPASGPESLTRNLAHPSWHDGGSRLDTETATLNCIVAKCLCARSFLLLCPGRSRESTQWLENEAKSCGKGTIEV